MARATDRRLRWAILVAGGLAGAGYTAFALTQRGSAARFMGFSIFLHAGLVFVVLCVVAALSRWIGEDVRHSPPALEPGQCEPPPTRAGGHRAA